MRWIPSRDTTFYGVMVNVLAQAGNLCLSLYDESFEQLATSGSVATPATGQQMLHLPAGGVAVTGGKTYWIDIASDNTATMRLAGWLLTNALIGTRMVAYGRGASGSFPPPATLLTVGHGVSIGTPNTGVALIPVTDPPRTAKPPTPLTMSINATSGQVFCVDPSTGRLWGSSGNSPAYSDDDGATWTVVTALNDGTTPKAMAIVGSSLLIATGGGTPIVGTVRRGPKAGPYTSGNFPVTLAAQEGAALPWNLIARADGVCMVGNYDSQGNGAAAVKLYRSADFGATWTAVISLGASDNATRHVHSVINLTGTQTWYANVGDSGALAGVYKSTDDGLTWTRNAAMGSIRLTPVVEVTGGILWTSDQFRMGGNLFFQNAPVDTKLQPRSHLDSPWHGDCYALTKDAAGVMWYVARFTNVSYTRTCILASPDEGKTSFLVADQGPATGYAQAVIRKGNYLFYEGKRYDVSSVDLTIL